MIRNTIIKQRWHVSPCRRLRFLGRSLATAAYENVSDKSIFDPQRFTFPDHDQERWNSLSKTYIRAVFSNNASLALKHLIELKKHYTSLDHPIALNQKQMLEFFQAGLCLYIEQDQRFNFKILNGIIQAYATLIKQVQCSGVDHNTTQPHINTILKTLLHAYDLEKASGKSKIYALPIKNSFKQVVESFQADLSIFSTRLTEEDLIKTLKELYPSIKSEQSSEHPVNSPPTTLPIESYLDDFGNLHFEKACQYIEDNKFQWNGETIYGIYDYYDSLPSNEKETFLKDYLAFNKIKQSTLEQYTHKLVKSPSKSNTTSEQSAKFIANEQEMLNTWIYHSCKTVDKLVVNSPASDNEKILYHFQQFIQSFPIRSIVGNVVYKLISSAYKEKVGVLEVLSGMRMAFRQDISLMKTGDNKPQLFKFISDDDFDKFSSILVKAVIESCVLPSEYTTRQLNSEAEVGPSFTVGDTKEQFAFTQSTIYTSPIKSRAVISINPILSQSLTSIPIGSDSHHFPLLCPPEPWLGVNKGAYLERNTPFLSGFDQLQQTILQNAHHQGKLDSAFKCLDQMGKTAWSINRDMLVIFNKLMQLSDGFLDIPPQRVDSLTKSKQEVIDIKGLRSNFETVNKLANAFGRNGDMLYHCYVFDFRGRVYPLSPLTHYGGDLTRSLFQFWHSRPLGANGFYWIKYQLMSVFGGSGAINCEEFFSQNKGHILESATDPLSNQWWMKADEPFSALSVCIEIKKILHFVEQDGGEIEEYLCRLPIHQDGSCNGLQHYAALAADESGGKAVNLVPMDTKQDVYSTVRDIVECKIIDDVENKLKGEARQEAEFMLKILDRKLIKRPVMTTVYGVTLAGASRQILENIEKIVSDHDENPSKRGIYDEPTIDKLRQFNLKSTIYLARQILSSIDELFFNAKQMEGWLVENTRRILTSYNVKTLDYLQLKTFASSSLTLTSASEALNNWYRIPISYSPISWVSAGGFPVIQTYRKLQPHSVSGALGSIMQSASSKYAPMDRRKHELAIAPNFIHSLDASHMFMTCDACACEEKKKASAGDRAKSLTFASIHDSYWTHPNQVDTLSQILRQTFVKLHSFEYMAHVRNDFINQVKRSHSFQLVYFDKLEYPDLYAQVTTIRNGYSDNEGRRMAYLLNHELKQLHNEENDHPVSQLIKQYSPKLYHIVGNTIREYSSNVNDVATVITNPQRKHLVPVFVPVQILSLPKNGNLDIRQVLQSKYFFS
ncbi:hypothetical protein CANMA_000177 [Candida margitis]|uniref:uncharacterized protein n=1 Tax=Candida margitis TaxID=1775924 RepID=UPI0022278A3E|nr:uncharacterized protein CANMA_000177 [Candida margitis]KAI5970758.1 hypothetical protein CANMA_000177 [Candida margitis]